MINFLIQIFLGVLLLSYTSMLRVQNTILDFFQATEIQEQVLLKWAISKGETCNGILITRSDDSLYFEAIGRIEGVCGSPEFQQAYSFVDENPLLNKKAYYRLELGLSDFSSIISVEIIAENDKGYQVRPQPIQYTGKIYFNNPEDQEWQLKIYRLNAQIIYQTSTRNHFFEIETSEWRSGVYLFVLLSEAERIQGKIIITK